MAESIVGLEAQTRALSKDNASSLHPIGFLAVDQVPYDIERAERFGPLVPSYPMLVETTEQCLKRGGRTSQHFYCEGQVEIHWSKAPPNGVRLSRAAAFECSRTQFYSRKRR